MGYRDNNSSQNEDRKGSPHPDAERNLRDAIEKIKDLELLGSMEVQYHDYDPHTGIIKEPKFTGFYWTDDQGRRYGNPISFHQNSSEFSKQIDSAIRWCMEHAYAKRKSASRTNIYK